MTDDGEAFVEGGWYFDDEFASVMATFWMPIADAPLPGPWPAQGNEVMLGYDGSDGGEPWAHAGYYRQNCVTGSGWVHGDGSWMYPQPTHFMPKPAPPTRKAT